MIVCDRDVCTNLERQDAQSSINSFGIPSTEEFMLNLLHQKCKVIQTVRRQLQKGNVELMSHTGPREISRKNVEQKSLPRFGKDTVMRDYVEPERTEIMEEPTITETLFAPLSTVTTTPSRSWGRSLLETGWRTRIADRIKSIRRFVKNILTINFPFYWIIVIVGILGMTSLLFGLILGAFVCTNGSNTVPFILRVKRRAGIPAY